MCGRVRWICQKHAHTLILYRGQCMQLRNARCHTHTNMSVSLHCVCEEMEGEHINIQPVMLRGIHSEFTVINNKESPVLPHSPRVCLSLNTVFESHRFHAASLISPPLTHSTHMTLSLRSAFKIRWMRAHTHEHAC